MARDVRSPQERWLGAVLAVVGTLAAYTAVAAAFPGIRFEVFSSDLRIALEVVQLSVALFAGLALLIPEDGELGPARDAFVAALVTMAVAHLFFGAGGVDLVDADVHTVGPVVFYPWLAGRYAAGVLFVVALVQPAWVRRWHYPVFVAGALALAVAAALAFGPRLPLPLVVFPGVPGGWAVRVSAPAEDLFIAAVPGALFGVGAWLAWRVAVRSGASLYFWLSLALVSQSFSMMHEMLYATTLGPLVTSIDLLRALTLLLLLVGALYKVRALIADRRATVESQAADLRAREDLLATMREFAEREELFRSVVVHELATPIATMGAFAHVLDRHADDAWSTGARTALRGLRDEAMRLQQLVRRMDELRRLELDEFSCDLRPLMLRPVVEDAARYARGLPGSHAAIVDCPGDVRVLADPMRIGQALRNVLTNAASYSPDGTPILLHCGAGPDSSALIRIEDDGPGIPVEDRERVLRKYDRGNEHPDREGSGLGLYIAHRIVEAHGGRLSFTEPLRLRGTSVMLVLHMP